MKVSFLTAVILIATSIPSTAAPSCQGSLEAIHVADWSITPIDARTNELQVSLENALGKPVRMIDASVGFIDALGEEIARYEIDRDAQIGADALYLETSTWGPFTFERLLKLKRDEVVPFACVRSILFDDGSKQEF